MIGTSGWRRLMASMRRTADGHSWVKTTEIPMKSTPLGIRPRSRRMRGRSDSPCDSDERCRAPRPQRRPRPPAPPQLQGLRRCRPGPEGERSSRWRSGRSPPRDLERGRPSARVKGYVGMEFQAISLPPDTSWLHPSRGPYGILSSSLRPSLDAVSTHVTGRRNKVSDRHCSHGDAHGERLRTIVKLDEIRGYRTGRSHLPPDGRQRSAPRGHLGAHRRYASGRKGIDGLLEQCLFGGEETLAATG